MFLESTLKAFGEDIALHALGNGCGRPVAGVLPLFEGGAAPTGIPGGEDEEKNGPSRQKIFVDWTLCRGHGLCADILPEVFQLGADGFPTVAQAQVPRYAEAKALRAVRRCPALALRIEDSAPQAKAPSRNSSGALPGPRQARSGALTGDRGTLSRPSPAASTRRRGPFPFSWRGRCGDVRDNARGRTIRSDDPPSTSVELRRIELLTSCMPCRRSTN